MNNVLVEMMAQFIALTKEEALAIEESFPVKQFTKDTFLLEQGQVAKEVYFVIEGCIRRYALNDGEEVTSDIYIEGDSVADFNSLANQIPSNFFFTCIETSMLAVINAEKEAALYKKFPHFETVCRVEFEKMMGKAMEEKELFSLKSPEDKYLQLLKERPRLLNRVPQYQIASYLGIKPETLSRIRKRISEK